MKPKKATPRGAPAVTEPTTPDEHIKPKKKDIDLTDTDWGDINIDDLAGDKDAK